MDLAHEQRLTAVEERSKSNTKRIDEMEKRQNDLDELVSTVKVLAVREEAIENDVKEMKSDVKSMTEKPGKMWEKVVEKVILTLIAAALGFLLAQIGL